MAVLRQHLPSVPRCCPCAASLALAASCTLARVCTRLARLGVVPGGTGWATGQVRAGGGKGRVIII
jgi:hypothetical protein